MSETVNKPKYSVWAESAVMVVAKQAMNKTEHRVIDTPHILMAITKTGPAANLLQRTFEVDPAKLYVIVSNMPKPMPNGIGEDFLYSDNALEVLKQAQALASTFGFRHGQIYTDHLLAAVLQVKDESIVFVLNKLGVDYDALQAEVMKSLEQKSEIGKE